MRHHYNLGYSLSTWQFSRLVILLSKALLNAAISNMVFTTPHQTPEEQYALSACLAVLASVMVGLRFYAVKVRKDKCGWDDYFIVIALVSTEAGS